MPQNQPRTQSEAVSIAAMLGLPKPEKFDGLMLAEAIALGVPPSSVAALAKVIDPSGVNSRTLTLVPPRTLHRSRSTRKPLSKDRSETLWQLAKVMHEAHRQYGNTEEARDFLFRPHPLLDGKRPADLAVASAAGADLVMKILQRAEAGLPV